MENIKRYDTIVIGAGVSGLCAARKLESYGQNVLVIEAQDRVGGRTYTVTDKHGATDLGGAYIGPTQNRVLRLVKEFGLNVYNVRDTGSHVFDLKSVFSKFAEDGLPFWNPIKLLDLNNALRTLDNLAKQVPKEAPWKAKKAKEWDSTTIAQFLDKIVWTRSVREFMDIFMQCGLSVEPCEASLLGILWSTRVSGGIARSMGVTNGAQEKKIDGGMQQLSERMAETLKNGVKLSSPVVRLQQNDDGVVVTDIHGNMYKARHVISAVPVSLLNKISFDPALPRERIQMYQRIPMGCVIKTFMFYESTFWRDMEIDDGIPRHFPLPWMMPGNWRGYPSLSRMTSEVHEVFGLNGTLASTNGICSASMEDAKPDGSHPSIMGIIVADKAREMGLTTTESRKRAIMELYARVFDDERFLQPTDYKEYDWTDNQYAGGCYSEVMPPKFLTQYGKYLREPLGRLYFAGTITATEWASYIDGAIQAGERAACQILHKEGKIDEDEIWREEPESVDYPAAPIHESAILQWLPSVKTLYRLSQVIVVASISVGVFFLGGWLARTSH